MKIIITGATGYFGRALLDELILMGYTDIVCLLRKDSFHKLKDLEAKLSFRAIDFNSDDAEADIKSLGNADAIIHLVAILRENAETSYERLNFMSAKTMIDFAISNDIKRFLFMSAVGAPPFLKGYIQTKLRAEEYLRQSSLNWTIFKPSLIYNEDSFRGKNLGYVRFLNVVYDLGSKLPFNSGILKWKPNERKKLIACFIRALEDNSYIGKTLYSFDFK